jgi:hypothetical protein
MDLAQVTDLLRIIWPLILLQLLFQIYALYDLFKIKFGKTKNLTTVIWVIIIVLGEILGPALYFLLGRGEE